MAIRVGVNLIPLWPGKIGGMETYIRNLLEHISLLDHTNKYFLFTASHNNSSLKFSNPNFENILVDSEIPYYCPRQINKYEKVLLQTRYIRKFYKNWRRYLVRKSAALFNEAKLDIWFCPLISLDPRYLEIPTIITIPDIQQEYYPQFFTHDEHINRLMNWKQSCYEATRVLTISEFSKQSLCEKYNLSPEKVKVTLLSVAGEFLIRDKGKNKVVRKKYSLPSNYAYYPANTWPHKNHKLLIVGFYLFKKQNKSNLKLVLSGVDDARAELEQLINHFKLTSDVVFLSYIKRDDLPSVYRGANFMIFPSLFEGFGIILLEAFASDCPVAASNLTSIPEVAADAAYYFDPKNPEDIARAFKKMVNESFLKEDLIKKGRQRLKYFSWDKTAGQTIEVFKELNNG